MDEQERLFVYLTPEVEEILADNQTTLEELLRREGADVRAQLGASPVELPGTTSKEVVTILLASGAVILSLTPLITRVLSTLTHRPVVVKTANLAAVEDSKGNVVRDAKGNPRYYLREEASILQPKEAARRDKVGLDVKAMTIGLEASSGT